MGVGSAGVVLVCSRYPVVAGVLHLAASTLPGVDDVVERSDPSLLGDLGRADLVVVDIDPQGTEDLHAIRAAYPDALLVVLTEHVDGQTVLEALRLRVRGFLVKPDVLRDVVSPLRRVLDGERVFPPEVETSAAQALGRFARQAREGSAMDARFTSREREILILISEGASMQQIGRRLGISPRTVESHASRLYRKLEVRSRAQAVAKATQLGLIDLN